MCATFYLILQCQTSSIGISDIYDIRLAHRRAIAHGEQLPSKKTK